MINTFEIKEIEAVALDYYFEKNGKNQLELVRDQVDALFLLWFAIQDFPLALVLENGYRIHDFYIQAKKRKDQVDEAYNFATEENLIGELITHIEIENTNRLISIR